MEMDVAYEQARYGIRFGIFKDHRGPIGIGFETDRDKVLKAPIRNGLQVEDDLEEDLGPFDNGVKSANGFEPCPKIFVVRPDTLYPGFNYPLPRVTFGPISDSTIFDGTLERNLQVHLRDFVLWKSAIPERVLRTVRGSPSLSKIRGDHYENFFCQVEQETLTKLNQLLRALCFTAIPRELLRITRQYPISHRAKIYVASATSKRAMQIAGVFPVLAHFLYVDTYRAPTSADRLAEARALVEDGAPLKLVAKTANIPMALRKIGARVAHIAAEAILTLSKSSTLIHAHLPSQTGDAARWISALPDAERYGYDFVSWVAKNAAELFNVQRYGYHKVCEIGDWIEASRQVNDSGQLAHTATRRFDPRMSVRTVVDLSDEWHEAIVENCTLDDLQNPIRERGNLGHEADFFADQAEQPKFAIEFPKPWVEGAKIDNFEIVPITNWDDLCHEGSVMRNCVESYGSYVAGGERYIYSVRQGDAHVAIFELCREQDKISLGQFVGGFNGPPPARAVSAVHTWLSNAAIELPGITGACHFDDFDDAGYGVFSDVDGIGAEEDEERRIEMGLDTQTSACVRCERELDDEIPF